MVFERQLRFLFDRPRVQTVQTRAYEFLSRKWVLVALTVVPAMALFMFVNVIPIIWAVSASFFEVSAFSPVWNWNGLGNYAWVFSNPEFYATVSRSLVFAGGSVALQLTVGIAIALVMNREFKYASFLRAIIMLPYLVPTAIVGFIGLWMANSQYGLINQLLVQFGFIENFMSFFGNPDLAMLSVIVTSSWKFTIFVTIMVLARLQGIPEGLYEAATMAGATPYQKFRDITLPNLKGVIFIVVLLRGVWMFNKFDIIYVLTQGGPLNKTTTSAIWAYEVAFTNTTLGKAATISTVLFGLLVVTALLYFYVLEPSKEVRVE